MTIKINTILVIMYLYARILVLRMAARESLRFKNNIMRQKPAAAATCWLRLRGYSASNALLLLEGKLEVKKAREGLGHR